MTPSLPDTQYPIGKERFLANQIPELHSATWLSEVPQFWANQKTILISGATGSFGSALARHLLSTTPHKLRLLARSESRLADLERSLSQYASRLTFILADIRDLDRLTYAFKGVDEVFHAAALKIVGQGQVHVSEFKKTNIDGTYNVTVAAGINKVQKVLFISSDKGSEPHNLYGKTKAVAEEIIREANLIWHDTKFSSVRGGNIWGSRGSVVELWGNKVPYSSEDVVKYEVYGQETTRFHLRMKDWLDFCIRSMSESHGGEIFVPRCKSWALADLAQAFVQTFGGETILLPARSGDKTHETLISAYELANSLALDWGYIIEPSAEIRAYWDYRPHSGYPVTEKVSSDLAERVSVEELVKEIEKAD